MANNMSKRNTTTFNPKRNYNKEHHFIKSLKDDIKPDYFFVDVGANIGFYTLMVLGLTQGTAKILAFEPKHSIYTLLKERVVLEYPKNNVQIHNIGLWTETSMLPFYDRDVAYWSGKPTTQASGFKEHPLDGIKSSSIIEVQPLTNYISQTDIINYLKIDVEGSEYEVLLGSLPLLQNRQIRNIFIEYHKRLAQPIDLTVDLLETCGYKVTIHNENQFKSHILAT